MLDRDDLKFNLCNMLLTIVMKHAPNTDARVTPLATYLVRRAESFDPKLKNEFDNVKNYLRQKNLLTSNVDLYRRWLEHELGVGLEPDFMSKPFIVDAEIRPKVSSCRRELGLATLENCESVDSGFYDIHINREWRYKSITSVDLNDKREDESLPNYLLYQAYAAAALWDEVTSAPHYKLPGYCKAGLQKLFLTPSWQELTKKRAIFFELGTGSPAKTALILDRLSESSLSHDYVWVDASTPMLEYNVSKIDTNKYPSLRFTPISTDFEAIHDLLDFLGERWKGDGFHSTRKCYCLLGFTLSNLDEGPFIRRYASVCRKGDVLIFPIQFIPPQFSEGQAWSGIESSNYGKELIASYNSEEGKRLVKAGLGQIKGQTSDFSAAALPIRVVGGTPGEDCIGRSVLIRYMATFRHQGRGGAQRTKRLEIIKTSRYFESDFLAFLVRHGFEVKENIETFPNTKTLLIEFVGKST